jgi:hypothetical protein
VEDLIVEGRRVLLFAENVYESTIPTCGIPGSFGENEIPGQTD